MIKKVVHFKPLQDEEASRKDKTGIELIQELNFLISTWYKLDDQLTPRLSRSLTITKRKLS